MAYDLEEQEQLAALKAWWNEYGNLVTTLITLALAAYAAWTGWNYYLRKQTMQASQLYGELQKAVGSKDNARVQRAAGDIEEKFGRTAYAEMAALSAAKSAVDTDDTKTAKVQLQWVVDHALNEEYRAIAKVRLAGVLLDEKNYSAAMTFLNGEFPTGFTSVVADRKGDILAAEGKRDEARAAYKLALDMAEKQDSGRQLIQLKLDALGGASDKPAA